MTSTEIKEYILRRLGDPVVDVEVSDLIDDIVNDAFIEVKHYITTTRIITVPFSGSSIDLTDYKVDTVMAIYRPDRYTNQINPDDVMFSQINLGRRWVSGQPFYYGMAQSMLIDQLKNTMNKDLDFRYEKPKLYLSLTKPQPTSITIEYIYNYESVDEVEEVYWTNLIRRLALALTKESLGRARGKYRLQNAPYEMDGDTLLNEANQELSEIRSKLDENSDVMFPLD